MYYSVRPHRWQPTWLLHPWDSPGKSTGVGCHSLLQGWECWPRPGRLLCYAKKFAFRWYWWTYLQGSNGNTDINRLVDYRGARREWGKLREQSGNIYITICKIDSKWEFAVWHRELNLVLCDNLEGWDGRWKGSSGGKGHMYTYGWFMLMFSRNQHNIVKQLSSY